MTRSEDADVTDLGLAAPVDPGEEWPVIPRQQSVEPSGPPATAESRRRHVAAIRAEQGWDGASSTVEREALGRPCRHCHASIWEGCVSRSGHRLRRPHDSRLQAETA